MAFALAFVRKMFVRKGQVGDVAHLSLAVVSRTVQKICVACKTEEMATAEQFPAILLIITSVELVVPISLLPVKIAQLV